MSIHIDISNFQQRRTLWMDGPPHSFAKADHTWMAFSTYPCTAVVELADQPRGAVPHYFPGENPFLEEFGAQQKLPGDATRGEAATMYREFQKTLSAR